MKILGFVALMMVAAFICSGPIYAEQKGSAEKKKAKLEEILVLKAARAYEKGIEIQTIQWSGERRTSKQIAADVKVTYALMLKAVRTGKVPPSFQPYLAHIFKQKARKEGAIK